MQNYITKLNYSYSKIELIFNSPHHRLAPLCVVIYGKVSTWERRNAVTFLLGSAKLLLCC